MNCLENHDGDHTFSLGGEKWYCVYCAWSLASNEVVTVDVKNITNDPEDINWDGEYAWQMVKGFYSPDHYDAIRKVDPNDYYPLIVSKNGDKFDICDGMHRYAALTLIHRKTNVKCRILDLNSFFP